MSIAQETRNKAVFRRFHEATNSGDPQLISDTIDEIVDPDVLIRTHTAGPSDRRRSAQGGVHETP